MLPTGLNGLEKQLTEFKAFERQEKEKSDLILFKLFNQILDNQKVHETSKRVFKSNEGPFQAFFNDSIFECSQKEPLDLDQIESSKVSQMILPKERVVFGDDFGNKERVVLESFGVISFPREPEAGHPEIKTEEDPSKKEATVLQIFSTLRTTFQDLDFLIAPNSFNDFIASSTNPFNSIFNRMGKSSLNETLNGDQVPTGSSGQQQETTTTHRPPLTVLLGEAVGDYFFRLIHSMLSRFLNDSIVLSSNDDSGANHVVSSLLKCEMDSIPCFVDSRYDAVNLRMCVQELCSCLNSNLPMIGESMIRTKKPTSFPLY